MLLYFYLLYFQLYPRVLPKIRSEDCWIMQAIPCAFSAVLCIYKIDSCPAWATKRPPQEIEDNCLVKCCSPCNNYKKCYVQKTHLSRSECCIFFLSTFNTWTNYFNQDNCIFVWDYALNFYGYCRRYFKAFSGSWSVPFRHKEYNLTNFEGYTPFEFIRISFQQDKNASVFF